MPIERAERALPTEGPMGLQGCGERRFARARENPLERTRSLARERSIWAAARRDGMH